MTATPDMTAVGQNPAPLVVEVHWALGAAMFGDGDNIYHDGQLETPGNGPTVNWYLASEPLGDGGPVDVQIVSEWGARRDRRGQPIGSVVRYNIHGTVRLDAPVPVRDTRHAAPLLEPAVLIEHWDADPVGIVYWDGTRLQRIDHEFGDQPIANGMHAYRINRSG